MPNIFSIIIAGSLVFIVTTTLMSNSDSTDAQLPIDTEISTTQAVTSDEKQPRVQPLENSELAIETNNRPTAPQADPFTKEPDLASLNEPKEETTKSSKGSRKYTSEDEWNMSEQTLEALTDLGNILN